mgnify:CR=1 FL=1
MKKGQNTFPIPNKLNVFLTLIYFCFSFFILILGSSMDFSLWFFILAMIFGISMIPIYSLLHESDHNVLHSSIGINNLLGRILSLIFVAPYTFLKQCHLGHHRRNRTDFEMFDLYYDYQSKIKRRIMLWILLLGVHWLLLPLSAILLLFYPSFLSNRLFRSNVEAEGMLSSINASTIAIIRLESISLVLFHVVVIYAFHLNPMSYLVMYLFHAFVWSSQNYVNHAYSERDIINGAHNHKVGILGNLLYLNFNLHLAHHQNPKISWIHLPKLVKTQKGRKSFFRAYLELWKGPILTTEASPIEMDAIKKRKSFN